jgi:hypothetical protein
MCELTDSVYRVVVVVGKQVARFFVEGIRLAHDFEGAASVGGEDCDVFGRVSAKEAQYVFTSMFYQFGGCHRGGVAGMWVAENLLF